MSGQCPNRTPFRSSCKRRDCPVCGPRPGGGPPSTLARPSTRHGIQYVERERNWPHQWLGRCRCGCAIRTNSESDVYRFFKEQGCVT